MLWTNHICFWGGIICQNSVKNQHLPIMALFPPSSSKNLPARYMHTIVLFATFHCKFSHNGRWNSFGSFLNFAALTKSLLDHQWYFFTNLLKKNNQSVKIIKLQAFEKKKEKIFKYLSILASDHNWTLVTVCYTYWGTSSERYQIDSLIFSHQCSEKQLVLYINLLSFACNLL